MDKRTVQEQIDILDKKLKELREIRDSGGLTWAEIEAIKLRNFRFFNKICDHYTHIARNHAKKNFGTFAKMGEAYHIPKGATQTLTSHSVIALKTLIVFCKMSGMSPNDFLGWEKWDEWMDKG